MTRQQRAEQKLVTQLVSQARWLAHERCRWELVRLVRTERGTLIDVEHYTSDDANLFGLLALLVVWRDHARLPAGRVELRWGREGRAMRVALRVGR